MTAVRAIGPDDDLAGAAALVLASEREVETACCPDAFAHELARLREVYAPPGGRILVADDAGAIVGVAALRVIPDGDVELRRLYVLPERRGHGVGGALAVRAVAEARAAGHRAVRAEIAPGCSPAAEALLRALGFDDAPAHVRRPLAGAVYLVFPLR